MLRIGKVAAVLAVVIAAGSCSSSHKNASATAPTTNGSTPATASAPTSVPSSTTSITEVLPTVSLPCDPLPFPVTPVKSPVPNPSTMLLTQVAEQGDRCLDHVEFGFSSKSADPPSYTITYGTPPFVEDGSGDPVKVAGTAFIVVKVQPGYGFDFEQGRTTYTGPKQITPAHANHVAQIVETGDFEGVITWVIGMDTKRPFSVQATGKPQTQLVVSVG
jgi:hypothetical protein